MHWFVRFSSPLRRAAEFALTREDDNAQSHLHRRIGELFRFVLAGSGLPGERDFEAGRFALRERPPQEAAELIGAIRLAGPANAGEIAEALNDMPPGERREIIRIALGLGIGADRKDENHAFLQQLALAAGIGEEVFSDLENQLDEAEIRRRKLLRSGAGIAVALIVIVVFILTATLLKSVIFGLIAAYVMLPLEKFFERKLATPGTLLHGTYHLLSLPGLPLRKLAEKLRRRRGSAPLSQEEIARRTRSALIARAVFLTTLVMLAGLLLLLSALTSMSGRYVHNWRAAQAAMQEKKTVQKAQTQTQTPEELPARIFRTATQELDRIRARFDQSPLVRNAIARMSKTLTDEHTQQEVVKFVLNRTGGMFAFTAGLVGGLIGLLMDLLLTVFFFLLFLTKLAEFRRENTAAWQSEYLVHSMFSGAWLPGAGENTLLEAQRILSEVINRLKIWLRGYLTLVLVDATVYTTVFWMLDVPYFLILGPLAGCGVLLPYIGPVVSCGLTLLVTLAAGGDAVSTRLIISILATYLVYNGVIEQFILYPMVIGESLGLTTLETIIVVLLGAIFAGIAGMLFAIPAASVLKYLVPQIYHCFDRRKGDA